MRRDLVLFQTHFLCAPSRPFRFQETNISFRESANISFCGLYISIIFFAAKIRKKEEK